MNERKESFYLIERETKVEERKQKKKTFTEGESTKDRFFVHFDATQNICPYELYFYFPVYINLHAKLFYLYDIQLLNSVRNYI